MKKDKPEYMANTSFFVMEKSELEALSNSLFRKAAVSVILGLGHGNELQQSSWSSFFVKSAVAQYICSTAIRLLEALSILACQWHQGVSLCFGIRLINLLN